MSMQSFNEVIALQKAPGTLFNTYTTAKSIINKAALVTLPPNWLVIGKMLRITALMGLSNIVTTPGTITFQIMIGSVIAFTTGAIQLNATAHTLLPLWFEAILTLRAEGETANANFMGMARVQGIQPTLTAAQVDAPNTPGIFSAPASTPAVGTGFDSTISNVVDFWAGFSISNGGNGVQVQQYIVEALN